MGNSGSIHHIASGLDELHSYYQHQNVGQSGNPNSSLDFNNSDIFQNPNGINTSWKNSNQYSHRKSFIAQQQPHIKVLPELSNGPRLRSTMNGAILHSGGTISGRKDSIPPPPAIIQRSKTSINYQSINRNSSSESAPPIFRRSQTQVNMLLPLARQESSNYSKDGKNFISEPDLRTNYVEDCKKSQSPPTQLNTSKSKIKIKKRKAPLAPDGNSNVLKSSNKEQLKPADVSAIRDKSRQVLGIQPSHQKQLFQTKSHILNDHNYDQDHEQKQQQNIRKLRLFKTKAESKSSTITGEQNLIKKGPAKSSSSLKTPFQNEALATKDLQYKLRGTDTMNPHIHNTKTNWIESKIKLLPVPVFRREKSFDVSLLSQHNHQNTHSLPVKNKTTTENDDTANSRQRIKANRNYNDDNLPRQSAFFGRQATRTSFIETKFLPLRKYSTPPKVSSQTLFQNELEAATKRRSLAVVENLENTNLNKLTFPKSNKGLITIDSPSQSKPIASVRKPLISDSDSKKQQKADENVPKKIVSPNLAKTATKTTVVSSTVNRIDKIKTTNQLSGIVISANTKNPSKIPQLTKTFYFGMENAIENESNNDSPLNILQDTATTIKSASIDSDSVIIRKNSSRPLNINKNDDSTDKIDHSQMKVIDEFAKNIMYNQDPLEYRRKKHNEIGEFNMISSESAESSDETDMINIGVGAIGGKRTKNFYTMKNSSPIEEVNNEHGIQVTVRPTLPRRQLEIPRFSPSAAWRMLSAEHREILLKFKQQRDADSPSSSKDLLELSKMFATSSDNKISIDQQPPLEKRIQRNYREPNPLLFADNKSGDSGISGDGGFNHERTDNSRILPNLISGNVVAGNNIAVNDNNHQDNLTEVRNANIGPFLPTWTPQEDLEEEDTSSEGGEDITETDPSRGHVFSFSLPRETHFSIYGEKDKPSGFSSLQKLKRTVSSAFSGGSSGNSVSGGCLGNVSPHILTAPGITSLNSPLDGILGHGFNGGLNYRSDNWLLSRSAPNSIDNNNSQHKTIDRGTTITGQRIKNSDDNNGSKSSSNFLINRQISFQPLTLSFLTAGKHVMYLPNQPIGESSDFQEDDFHADCSNQKHSIIENKKNSEFRKGNNGNKKRENLQDMPTCRIIESTVAKKSSAAKQVNNNNSSSKISRNHRFTFQSTVRQIERRRLAEKLSKEAEQKEAQRKSELEAMRRVEEEFQMKRAREKASIRHQLRLYSMGENHQQCTSLPHDWQETAHSSQHHRAEPDGAVSSSSSSSSPLSHRRYRKIPIVKATPFFNNDDSSLSYNENLTNNHTASMPIMELPPSSTKTQWNSTSNDNNQTIPSDGHFALTSESNVNLIFGKGEKVSTSDRKNKQSNFFSKGHLAETNSDLRQLNDKIIIASNNSHNQTEKYQNKTCTRSISSDSEISNLLITTTNTTTITTTSATDSINHQFRDINYQHRSRCAELN